MLVASCATRDAASFTNVYVADFHTDEPAAACRTSDVPQSHGKAREFFSRAKDNYQLAPCYVEGTLTRQGRSCDWQIRAGATGSVQCGEQKLYFACDNCDDLFGAKQ